MNDIMTYYNKIIKYFLKLFKMLTSFEYLYKYGLDYHDTVSNNSERLTLNSSKCAYNKRSLEFLGHTSGNEDISPNNLKIKAILGLPDPKNAPEVRIFLGMTNFFGAEFIPNYAILTHELRQLTKKTKHTVVLD